MNRKSAVVDIICLVTKQIEHLGVHNCHDEIEGVICIGDDYEQSRFPVGAEVCYSIIAENAVIKKGARVGARPETVEDKAKWGVAVVAEGRTIGENASVGPKAMLEKDVQDGEKLW